MLRSGFFGPFHQLGSWLSLESLVLFQCHPEEALDAVGADFDGKVLNVHAPIGVAKGQFVKLLPVELLVRGHCLPQLPELYRVSRCLASPRELSGRLRLWQPLDTEDRLELARKDAGVGYCNITKCCTEVCPEEIHITDNAIIPLKERVADRYFDPIRWIGSKIFGRS